MARLKIYKDKHGDSTVIPNIFIDEYMEDANDTQLKVYLYLIRMLNAGMATSVSDIADKFGHTEKNVLRAMKYWEKRQLLSLEYDDEKNLVGVQICDLTRQESPSCELKLQAAEAALTPVKEATTKVAPTEATAKEAPTFVKPSYSAEQMKNFCDDESIEELLFLAQTYVGKTLTPSEMKTVIFFSDVLHFSNDLIDYLLQYCVELGKKDFRYMEKVAISWAQQGISTPEEAYEASNKYNKSVYTIMNALGKSNSPTNKEMEYIIRWTRDYGFSNDIIIEACDRTVLATDKHRFEYAEGILKNWKLNDVKQKEDISKIDAQYQKSRTRTSTPKASVTTNNKFNQFAQNTYDFAELERELLSN
ncbi:MAG: DnaD domain protein [Lachnospiraceae bacterium]|nr:DnaD domain protein [Lachnospiraceae bacterium]